MRAESDRDDRVNEPDQIRSAASGRSKATTSGYFQSQAAAGMGTESRFGERAEAFAGIFSRRRGGKKAALLAPLFVELRTRGENRKQAQNFFALGRIAEREAHAHAETGMGSQHLARDSQFHVGRADHNLHPQLPSKWRWHFDVATTFADVG